MYEDILVMAIEEYFKIEFTVFLISFLIYASLFGIITAIAASKKGRSTTKWFFGGFFLGVFGFIIVLLLDSLVSERSPNDLKNNESILQSPKPLEGQSNQGVKEFKQLNPRTQILTEESFKEFIPNWPINPKLYSLEVSDDKATVQLANFEFRNIQNRTIKYSEWKVLCFDILSRQISTNESIILKIESEIFAGGIFNFDKSVILPVETKKVKFRLLNILYDDGEILNTEDTSAVIITQKPKSITDHFDTQESFLRHLKRQLELKDMPYYIHENGTQGLWTCSFCGILNSSTSEKCQCCETRKSEQEKLTENKILDLFTAWEVEQYKIRQREELAKQRQKEEEEERLEREELEKVKQQEIEDEKRRRQWRLLIISVVVIVVLSLVILVAWQLILKDVFAYNKGLEQQKNGEYFGAVETFSSIIGYKDSRRLAGDNYVLYIENAIDDYNADKNISTTSVYSWLLTQNYPKDLIFESITKIDGQLVEEEKDLIRLWLDQNEFHAYLPIIKLVSNDNEANKEVILSEIKIEKFADYFSLPDVNSDNINKYGHNLTGWEFLFEGKMIEAPQRAKIRPLIDQKIHAIWKPLQIGEIGPAGGVIAYNKGSFSNGWQFIEVAPVETEWINVPWSGFMNRDYQLGSAIGDGKSNTNIILEKTSLTTVTLKTFQYAPHLCANLNYNGFDDWILPSKEELNLLYSNLHINSMGDFNETNYWTSTDMNEFSAWVQRFSNGFQFGHDKYKLANARAIRYF